MKKRIFLSIFVALTAIISISAQDLDEILKNHFKAIGQENLLNVKTMKATGKFNSMGMEAPLELYAKRPDKFQLVIEYQGAKIIQCYDGNSAWQINPFMGSADPQDLAGPEAESMKESADLDGLLWNYKEKGHQLELEGTEEVEGTETFVLKLTKKNGNIDRYFLDKESYLPIQVIAKTFANGSEMEGKSLLSNYQDINGYMMPFTMDQSSNMGAASIIFEKVELDVELDDAQFAKPTGN